MVVGSAFLGSAATEGCGPSLGLAGRWGKSEPGVGLQGMGGAASVGSLLLGAAPAQVLREVATGVVDAVEGPPLRRADGEDFQGDAE